MGGDSDEGLRPLESFVDFTVSLEEPQIMREGASRIMSVQDACGNNININRPTKKSKSSLCLILANRAVVYNQMAIAWQAQGHNQHVLWSLQTAWKALREFHRVGGNELVSSNAMPTVLSNMAHVHFRLGDLETALDLSFEALNTHDGTEDDFRAELLFNIGRLLFVLDRNSTEAEHALSCALHIISSIQSESQERDIVTVQTLLLLIQEQKDRESDAFAIALLRALVQQRAETACENDSVAQTLFQLGEIYMKRGSFKQATMFLSEALHVQRQLGVQGVELLITLSQLGQCLHADGEHAEAMLCFREALRVKGSTIYQDSPRVQAIFATVLYNVGMLQSVHGDRDDDLRNKRALQSFRICLDLRTKALGRMHPDVASVLHNIGYLLLQEGQPLKSLQVFQESLEIRLNTLGPNHQEVASSLRHIGRVYQDRGDFDKALRVHVRAYRIITKKQNEQQQQQQDESCNSGELVEVLMGLGQAQQSMGQLEEAFSSYQQAVQHLGRDSNKNNAAVRRHIAQVLNVMANLSLDMSNISAANAFLAEAASLIEMDMPDNNDGSFALFDELTNCAAAA